MFVLIVEQDINEIACPKYGSKMKRADFHKKKENILKKVDYRERIKRFILLLL
jgi:hypothetical protein